MILKIDKDMAEEKSRKEGNASLIPGLGKEVARFDGETFNLVECEDGILFHSYNSMDLIIRPGVTSAFETLRYIIHQSGKYASMDEEERKDFDFLVQGVSYVLRCPTVAFIDADFTFDLTKCIIDNMTRLTRQAMDKPLSEEDKAKDEIFKQAMIAMDELKEMKP